MLRNGNKYILMLSEYMLLRACEPVKNIIYAAARIAEFLAEQHNNFVAISWHNVGSYRPAYISVNVTP